MATTAGQATTAVAETTTAAEAPETTTAATRATTTAKTADKTTTANRGPVATQAGTGAPGRQTTPQKMCASNIINMANQLGSAEMLTIAPGLLTQCQGQDNEITTCSQILMLLTV